MKRLFRLLGGLFVTVVVVSTMLATSAFGATQPTQEPFEKGETFTGENDGTGEDAEPQFNSSTGTVVCKEATAEGTIESNSPPLGTFHIHFAGCKDKGTGATCTGSGENAGIILVLGTWHLPWDETSTNWELTCRDPVLNRRSALPVHSAGLNQRQGQSALLRLRTRILKEIHLFHCLSNGNSQTDTWCTADKAGSCMELETPLLLSSTNHATFKEAAELALGSVKTTRKVATVEL